MYLYKIFASNRYTNLLLYIVEIKIDYCVQDTDWNCINIKYMKLHLYASHILDSIKYSYKVIVFTKTDE